MWFTVNEKRFCWQVTLGKRKNTDRGQRDGKGERTKQKWRDGWIDR